MKYLYLYLFINLLISIKPLFKFITSSELDKDYLGFIGAYIFVSLFGILLLIADLIFRTYFEVKLILKKFGNRK